MSKKNTDVSGTEPEGSASHDEKQGPVKQLRIEDVSASIFARRFSGRTYFSTSFTRSYKDASGSWKYGKTFDSADLAKVAALAEQAANWIAQQQEAA